MAKLHNIRARAFGAFALFCIGFGAPAFAGEEIEFEEDSTAVYLARVASMNYVGSPPCPVDYICMDSVFDMEIEPVETLGNSPNIGSQTFRVVQHGPYIDGTVLVIAAQRDTAGQWHLVDRTRMERRACFNDPRTDFWDNFEDPENEWEAIRDENSGEICLYGRDRPD